MRKTMFSFLKSKPKLYQFRIWYHFKVSTNIVSKLYAEDITCWASTEERALYWFAKENPHVIHTGIINEGKV